MLQGAVLPASDLISHFLQKAGVIQCMQFAPMYNVVTSASARMRHGGPSLQTF